MRVLVDGYIYTRSFGGGTVRYCDQLVSGLATRGIDVALALDEGARHRREHSLPDVPVLRGRRAAELFSPDVLHVPYSSRFRRLGDASVVATIHDMIDETLPPELTRQSSDSAEDDPKRQAIETADMLVAVSGATRDALVARHPTAKHRLHVVRHAVPRVFTQGGVPRSPLVTGTLFGTKPYLLHVGGREGYKNFTFLLRAFSQADASRTHSLVVVGSQPCLLPDEAIVVREKGLESCVIILGHVADPVLYALYHHAALVVMPSLQEGFGYPMLEALSCGALVACSTAPALLEVGGEAPFVFDPLSEASAASAIDEGVRRAHADRRLLGRSRASEFTERRMIDGYLEAYASASRAAASRTLRLE